MTRLSNSTIKRYFKESILASSPTEQGRAFESLVCYIFKKIPGVSVRKRNIFNLNRTQEIDIAFWNKGNKNGFHFLPPIFIAECKNWSQPADGEHVSWFIEKLRDKGLTFGIFVARSGITGRFEDSSGAYDTIIRARRDGILITVLTGVELESLTDIDSLITLFQEKICELSLA